MFGETSVSRINVVYQRRSRKSRTCEVCNKEIPKGDLYFQYKPLPQPKFWYGWRDRCIDHKPKYYDEFQYYHNEEATTTYIKKRFDYQKS